MSALGASSDAKSQEGAADTHREAAAVLEKDRGEERERMRQVVPDLG
jgi:hypothetical protein